jgi:Uma2 family endonuclease
MSTAVPPAVDWVTAADLLKRLGGIGPSRLRLRPAPGTATEQDLLDIYDREKCRCELVAGVLVEKVMGYPESMLALWLAQLLYRHFLEVNDLGVLGGEAGPIRLMPGLVRIPDLSFVRWDRLPAGKIPSKPILGLAPDLAVEVLSRGNTRGEMARKVREYFLSGVRLVWLVDPRKHLVRVYTAPDDSVRLTEKDVLDGGDVLPGLQLPVKRIFERLEEKPVRKQRPKK